VATVRHGESNHIVQNIIFDAGFNDLNIFPMGVDKVFISNTLQLEVMCVINSARDFLNCVLWKVDVI